MYTIYKTHYHTLGHHALAVILCSCLNLFWVINSLIVLTKPNKPKKIRGSIFLTMKVTIPGTPSIITFNFNVESYYNFYHFKLFSKFRYFPSNCCYLLLSYQWYFDSALKQQEGIQSDGMSVDWGWIIGKCRRMVLSFLTIHGVNFANI